MRVSRCQAIGEPARDGVPSGRAEDRHQHDADRDHRRTTACGREFADAGHHGSERRHKQHAANECRSIKDRRPRRRNAIDQADGDADQRKDGKVTQPPTHAAAGRAILTLTADYYHYKLRGLIVADPVAGMINALFGTSGTANCANAAYAGLRSRFLFSDGGGVPGAGTCSLTNVSRVFTDTVNGSDVTTSGVDVQMDATFNNVLGGSVQLGGAVTYVINYKLADQLVEGIVVQPGFDAAGLLNYQTTAYPLPKWKGQGYIGLSHGIFDGRLTVNYIGGYTDQRVAPFAPRVDLVGLIPDATQLASQHIGSFVTADFTI